MPHLQSHVKTTLIRRLANMKISSAKFRRAAAFALLSAVLVALFLPDTALGGTTGTEFQSIYDKVKGWSTGYLGRLLALCTFIIGLGASIMRQTLFPALTGIGVALVVSLGPSLIEGIATGTF